MNKPEKPCTSHKPSNNELAALGVYTEDSDYLKFMHKYNGGYFYYDSLQIYPSNSNIDCNGIIYINALFNRLYIDVAKGLFSFGQDTFANQFCFSKNGVVLFNIETGEEEWIADSFTSWEKALSSDLDYLTGLSIRKEFCNKNHVLKQDDRLCPKIPFLIGGEYKIDNLYQLPLEETLLINNNIWKQTRGLPDGTSITLENV